MQGEFKSNREKQTRSREMNKMKFDMYGAHRPAIKRKQIMHSLPHIQSNEIKRHRKKTSKAFSLRVNGKKRIIPKSNQVVGGSYCLSMKLIKKK